MQKPAMFAINMSPLVILFLALLNCSLKLDLISAQSYGQCLTPKSERGTCIALNQCSGLYALLQNPRISEEQRNLLSRSQCGYVNKTVLVCCPPQPVTTPQRSGVRGTLPDPPQCGIDLTDRIFGGNVTRIDEFPWMALLEYTKPGNNKGHHCGGALINNRYVLTAAHCVKGRGIPANWRLTGVRLGEWDTTTNPDCEVDTRGKEVCVPEHIDVKIAEAIAHPLYNSNSANQQNDIALLRLENLVPNNGYIKPICLPNNNNRKQETYTGVSMDVAGWGKTETASKSSRKLKATVDVWNIEDCRNTYKTERINLESTHMCAGGKKGIDSCSGDSGGPLMVLSRDGNLDVFFLAGVVSFGPTSCGLMNWPGVYTRVGAYVDWIKDTIDP